MEVSGWEVVCRAWTRYEAGKHSHVASPPTLPAPRGLSRRTPEGRAGLGEGRGADDATDAQGGMGGDQQEGE